jgi:hypothetical protein
MGKHKQQTNKNDVDSSRQSKRPFVKSDLEAVLKSATKPLKQEQDETKSAETSGCTLIHNKNQVSSFA